MATGGKLQDDFLTCSVCMEVFVQPVSLNCQHSFCQNCLRKYIQTKEEAARNKTIPCPTCRQETPVPHPDRPVEEWAGQLKPGLLLTGLMDSIPQETNCCSWCQKKGKTTPAATWCAECEACLCSDCHKLHNTVPVLDHHEVSNLTGNKRQNVKRKHFCKKHDKKIKLFCKDCKKTICTVCCSISHRKCEDVVTIQDMLPEVKSQLRKHKEELEEIAETNKTQIVEYEGEINEFKMKSTSVKTDITNTIQAAVDHLRAKETELLGKLDVQTDRQTEDLRSKIKTKKTETQTYQQQSQFIQQALELEDEAQLFEMYLSSGSGVEGEVTETNREDRTDVAGIRFIHNLDQLKEEIEKMDVRSVDYTMDLTATPVLHEVIDAKLDGDVSCGVRDVVVVESSGTKVNVFADFNNQLKSVYQRGGKTCSSVLKVQSEPWSITVISEGKIVVSFHLSPRLNLVAVTPDLELLSTIQTRKNYLGLSALDQSTLVAGSKNPPSVDLIDMQGNILKTFSTLPVTGKSFIEPRYIHVTSQGTILVSDSGLKSVICLTQSGDVVFTYTPTRDRALAGPWGITSTSSGDILVADYWPHKVIHLSKTGDYIRDILSSQEDGLHHPSGLCVDGDKLCVAVDNKGLHKYKFK